MIICERYELASDAPISFGLELQAAFAFVKSTLLSLSIILFPHVEIRDWALS